MPDENKDSKEISGAKSHQKTESGARDETSLGIAWSEKLTHNE